MALRGIFLLFFVQLAGLASASSTPVALQSHKAIYELSLATAKSGSGIGDYVGRLAIEWVDTCSGFVTTQRIVSRLTNSEGGDINTDLSLTSWESPDGKIFRFKTRTRTDGEVSEEFEGRAETSAGAPPSVIFDKPEAMTVDLPPGTIFPTEHSIVLIKGAFAGERVIEANVFDGSGPDKIFRVVAFVSGPKGALDAERPDLVGQRSWRYRISYFPIGQSDATPDYEIGYRMYENGISTDLVLDYGDFTVKGVLSSLQLLPKRC